MQVIVRDNSVEQALKALKRKLQREGFFREMRRKKFYEKPSARKAREKNEALRRLRKLASKRAQREGLSALTPGCQQPTGRLASGLRSAQWKNELGSCTREARSTRTDQALTLR
jgi:small subunit ribosomal protein S21